METLDRECSHRCERCGKAGCDVVGEAVLCEVCLGLVVREWKIAFQTFGELAR